MRRFGLLGFLVLLLLVGAVGAVSYNLGVSAGAADAAIAEGASVIYAPGAGTSPFALILGFFFVVMIIGFVAKAFAGPRMPMGPGPWGRGRHGGRGHWDSEDVPEPFRPMLERWHRDAHASPPPGASGAPSAGQTAGRPRPPGAPPPGQPAAS
jgi:hypothetical protein